MSLGVTYRRWICLDAHQALRRAAGHVRWMVLTRSFQQPSAEEKLMPTYRATERPVGRRSFARLLGIAAVSACLLPHDRTASATELHDHTTVVLAAQTAAKDWTRTVKTSETAAALRDLWVGHIFWIRNVSLGALNKDSAALQTAEDQVVANAKAIAASIGPYYGASAQESFFKLLAGHYGAIKDYLVATTARDSSEQSKATQSLTSNAEEIASFLSKANPYLPKDAVHGLLIAHGGHHIQQIQQLQDRNYKAEAATWEEMKSHVYQIADATADALARQFVKKF